MFRFQAFSLQERSTRFLRCLGCDCCMLVTSAIVNCSLLKKNPGRAVIRKLEISATLNTSRERKSFVDFEHREFWGVLGCWSMAGTDTGRTRPMLALSLLLKNRLTTDKHRSGQHSRKLLPPTSPSQTTQFKAASRVRAVDWLTATSSAQSVKRGFANGPNHSRPSTRC